MKKQNPPVCPWGTTFAQAMDGRTGRKCRTQEGQRKQIPVIREGQLEAQLEALEEGAQHDAE